MKSYTMYGYILALLIPTYLFCNIEVYFSPQDHIKSHLIERIRHEKSSIKGALYLLFDRDVIQELIAAHDRGVKIEIIIDKGNLESEWNKIPQVHKAGISVFVYKSKDGILHDKFFIFESNKGNKPVLWTGSFNITYTADKFNRENVVVLEDGHVITAFKHEFEQIKKKSSAYRYKKTHAYKHTNHRYRKKSRHHERVMDAHRAIVH